VLQAGRRHVLKRKVLRAGRVVRHTPMVMRPVAGVAGVLVIEMLQVLQALQPGASGLFERRRRCGHTHTRIPCSANHRFLLSVALWR
jgi:hypothetical protein